MFKKLFSGRKEFPAICGLTFEIYWPHPTVKTVKDNKCFGFWAPTLICWRADAPFYYKWAFAVRVLGFGFGFADRYEDQKEAL